MTNRDKKTNVIVVGGGPAGVACGITLARAGKEVVIIERGLFIHLLLKKFSRILKRKLR